MSASRGRKSIFITGAGSGIGRASAKLFAERGWYVGLYDQNSAGIEETSALLPHDSFTSGLFDVRDRHGWSNAIAQFGDVTAGKMHVLFNNAGIARAGRLEDVTPEESDLVLDVNIKGVMNGIYAALPLLEATPGSRVINTASTAGLVGAPMLSAYTASKFAVRGLSEALDAEFSLKGIRVVALCPWFIETPILNSGASANANETMRASAEKMTVYPVEMAAEGTWTAAHTDDVIVTVGKKAANARFMSRLFPGLVRKDVRNSVLRGRG
jgi:NAD(P)-dependent dehydrogenase (short-subunit alcohol dehydrogenase family)